MWILIYLFNEKKTGFFSFHICMYIYIFFFSTIYLHLASFIIRHEGLISLRRKEARLSKDDKLQNNNSGIKLSLCVLFSTIRSLRVHTYTYICID